MKTLLLTLICFSFIACNSKNTDTGNNSSENTPNIEIKAQVVEASCGQCNFGLTGGNGCDLAVRIDGKAFFVDGTNIDKHGDAHAEHGFCSAVRKATVDGKVENGRFVASSFELMPVEKKASEEHNHDDDGKEHNH